MPYRSAVAPRLADLLLQDGEIAAQRAMNSGRIWGGAAQDIGRGIAGAISERRRAREDAPRRQYEAMQLEEGIGALDRSRQIREVGRLTQGDPEAYAREVGVIDPERGYALQARTRQDKLANLSHIGQRLNQHSTLLGQTAQLLQEVEAQPGLYTEVRPRVMEIASKVDPGLAGEFPEMYDPARVRGLLQMSMAAAEASERKARGIALLDDAETRATDALSKATTRRRGLAELFSAATDLDDWQEVMRTAREIGVPDREIAQFGGWSDEAPQRAARILLTPEQRARFDAPATPGSKEDIYGSYAAEFLGGRSARHMTASEKTRAERWWANQTRVPDRPATVSDNPRIPVGVENYIADLKGRGYTRGQAQQEVYGTWKTLTAAHPRLSAREVQRTIDSLFRNELDLGSVGGAVLGGDPDRDEQGAPDVPANAPLAADSARTASFDDVRNVARTMGITDEQARQRLEAQGVLIRD